MVDVLVILTFGCTTHSAHSQECLCVQWRWRHLHRGVSDTKRERKCWPLKAFGAVSDVLVVTLREVPGCMLSRKLWASRRRRPRDTRKQSWRKIGGETEHEVAELATSALFQHGDTSCKASDVESHRVAVNWRHVMDGLSGKSSA